MHRHLVPLVLLCVVGCVAPPTSTSPSDNPEDYAGLVDSSLRYRPVLGQPRWVVPSDALPPTTDAMAGNNNVDIIYHAGWLYMAWRTAETHFASKSARIEIVSSNDDGRSWRHEHTIALGADVREPRFLEATGKRLLFHWFEAGTVPTAFTPRWIWRIERTGPGSWSPPEKIGDPKEVPWTIKGPRQGRFYMTSYAGEHYTGGEQSNVEVRFRVSDDGLLWRPVDPARAVVYHGGVSEVAFELDEGGDLWTVTRNEEGDASGFGSHLCHAPAADLADWSCPAQSDPQRYDSPWIFRHAGELYLVARRDPDGPYDQGLGGLTLAQKRTRYLLAYSLRPKRTALYRIDRAAGKVVHLADLPSAGDTAFPSVRRTGPHTFLVANYTSPLDKTDLSWLAGQTEPTQIYLLTLTFVPEP